MARPTTGPTVYAFDFSVNPTSAGWVHTPANPGDRPKHSESEGWSIDRGGQIESPAISVTANPFQYYRLTFRSKASVQGYYAVFFRNAAGELLVDDDYASIYPSADWIENDIVFRGREGAASFTVSFIAPTLPQISDMAVAAVSVEDAAAVSDRLYATMPPVAAVPAADRWAKIPRTMERLAQGGPLRVVMLGDSIMNDTNNGLWDALVMRQYPKAEVHVITSVRGATGCWYYQAPEQFKSYIVDRKPDLLMLGGISNGSRDGGDGLAAMQSVIAGVKKQIGCEVLVLSGPMGNDWRSHGADANAPLPVQSPLPYPEFHRSLRTVFTVFTQAELLPYERIAALAAEMGVEYFDMYGPWHRYLGASRMPWNWFHRDVVHANDRGKQVLARMLEQYFAPKA